MEYKLPPLPVRHEVIDGLWEEIHGPYDLHDMRQYAEKAVAPLLAEIERLEKLQAIHPNAGIRQASAQMSKEAFVSYVRNLSNVVP